MIKFKTIPARLASVGLMAAMTAPAQAEWTGGDGGATNPLSCDGAAPAAAATAYNGGTPAGASDKGDLRVVDVPQLVGIGYFNATTAGVAEAAKELGTVDATTDGPAQANIDDQITLIDELAEQIGPDGSFAIVTSTFTTPNQARWIAEMEAYQAKCFPEMEWLETVEAQEDNILSFSQAMTLINKYSENMDGIVGMPSVATPLPPKR